MSIWGYILIIILLIYIIVKRNEYARKRQDIKQAGSDISVMVEKRAASLNDALSIAKIGYKSEVDGIEKLSCSEQLSQLAYLGQKYPSLSSVGNYSETLSQAFQLNNEITASRQILNGNITEYNKAVTAFPGNIIALLFRYKAEKVIDEENLEKHRHLSTKDVDFDKFQN